MLGTTNKYKLSVDFSKAEVACCPFATIYYSNVLTFLQMYPPSLQFTYKLDLRNQTPIKFTQKLHTKNYKSVACDGCDI